MYHQQDPLEGQRLGGKSFWKIQMMRMYQRSRKKAMKGMTSHLHLNAAPSANLDERLQMCLLLHVPSPVRERLVPETVLSLHRYSSQRSRSLRNQCPPLRRPPQGSAKALHHRRRLAHPSLWALRRCQPPNLRHRLSLPNYTVYHWRT